MYPVVFLTAFKILPLVFNFSQFSYRLCSLLSIYNIFKNLYSNYKKGKEKREKWRVTAIYMVNNRLSCSTVQFSFASPAMQVFI